MFKKYNLFIKQRYTFAVARVRAAGSAAYIYTSSFFSLLNTMINQRGKAVWNGDMKGHGNITPEDFQKHAEFAKANCPVSQVLSAVPEMTLEAKLA